MSLITGQIKLSLITGQTKLEFEIGMSVLDFCTSFLSRGVLVTWPTSVGLTLYCIDSSEDENDEIF